MAWFPKKRVVVPVDFSDNSFTAVDTAVQLVDDPADVIVVHVLQEISPVEPGVVWDTVDHESRIKHATEALQSQLKDRGHEDVTVDVRIGAAAHEIIELADHEQAELIVLTSHGRTGLQHLLIGSVAERVTRLAHCPVLILRR
ncbi:MAG TPA: universal stress protein [Pirellulaceae bacterium]|jgi:nucleotide-binding universal stress UspA family protein|nr:universal stress protein [Pirellulaceae bacterium]